MNNLDKM